ncbi:low molecular weight phosphatase family protein [Mycobacterium sp. B14F4]|uniref:arsenate reductase/protein-tyrosine-phosphatase family protein n=1 Tax=Mycobacterium sp. B14F4 TaxID=3153565 RepID=UPI00325F195F
MHILFVCTGNVCRSPTAERLAMEYVARSHIQSVLTASSAGTRAMVGHPIQPFAARVLTKLGGDPYNFAARQITPRTAASADLVITMTRSHRDDVLELVPRRLDRVFSLLETARLVSDCSARTIEDLAAFRPLLPTHTQFDIPDPMGRDETYFELVGSQIADHLPPILELCARDQSSSTA